MKILVAVDGSDHALAAVQCVIDHADWYREKPSVELVTVHRLVPHLHGMSVVVAKQQLERYYLDEGDAALAAARKKLSGTGLTYVPRILVGPVAERIVEHAAATGCDLICIGSRGLGDLGKALLGSTATRVVQLSERPILLVK